jgi:hypothetical protein
MGAFLRTRLCRFVATATAITLTLSTAFSTASVATAAGVASSPSAVSAPSAPPRGPAVVRELVEKRGEAKREFLLSDGTIRAEYYAEPISYRDAAGNLQPVDATLEETMAAGRAVAVNKSAGFELQLPTTLTGDWVSVAEGSAKVSLRPARRTAKGVAPVAGSIRASDTSTSTRTYGGAFEGADLAYESRADGVKESIILSEPNAATTTYSFDLALVGLTPRMERDGSIALLRGKSASPEMTIPRPVMWDSASEAPQSSDQVHYDLSGTGPVYRLDIVADGSWLSSPDRVYPVTVDPSVITTTGFALDTYVTNAAGKTNTNYSQSISGKVSDQYTAGVTEYALLQMGSAIATDMATKLSLERPGFRVGSMNWMPRQAWRLPECSGRGLAAASAA